jgi:2-dehydropantoate 2-reductase
MLQDVSSGRPTEIDALCGAVCREGKALGVATPVNEGLLRDVLALQSGRPAGRETR